LCFQRNMSDFLERTRSRPEHEKRTLAIITAGIITGIIFLIWISVQFAGGVGGQEASPKEAQDKYAPTTVVKEGVSGLFEDVKVKINDFSQ